MLGTLLHVVEFAEHHKYDNSQIDSKKKYRFNA